MARPGPRVANERAIASGYPRTEGRISHYDRDGA
jgi:hypothetical protein